MIGTAGAIRLVDDGATMEVDPGGRAGDHGVPMTAPDLLVLHALRLKEVAGADSLAVATGLGVDEVRTSAAGLEAVGQIQPRTGRIPGWSLTAEGREEDARAVARELAASGRREQVDAGYQGVLRLNEPFKALCTSWQMRALDTPIVNDHSDPDYDAAAIERLVAVHAAAAPVVAGLARALHRYEPYRRRFDVALARIRAGEVDWFTKPLIGSYRDVVDGAARGPAPHPRDRPPGRLHLSPPGDDRS